MTIKTPFNFYLHCCRTGIRQLNQYIAAYLQKSCEDWKKQKQILYFLTLFFFILLKDTMASSLERLFRVFK